MKVEPDGIPELIEHNGWTIWCWTGWKGNRSCLGVNGPNYSAYFNDELTQDDFNRAGQKNPCRKCGQPARYGDEVVISQGTRAIDHYSCVYGDTPDRIVGQWLARKGEKPNARYLGVHVDNIDPSCIAVIEYKPGDFFQDSVGGKFITEHTPETVREAAKQAGLQKLKDLIDQVEAQEVEADG